MFKATTRRLPCFASLRTNQRLNRPSMQSFSRSRGFVAHAGHQPTYPSATRPGRSRGRGTSTISHSLIRRWDYVHPSAKNQRSLQASPGSRDSSPTLPNPLLGRAGGKTKTTGCSTDNPTKIGLLDSSSHTTVHKACMRDREAAVATSLQDSFTCFAERWTNV